MLLKRTRGIIFLLFIVMLSACGASSTEDKMYDHLEEAVTLEDSFEEQQDPIVDLEQKEQSLYGEIIELGMDDLDKVKELSDQALETIDERADKTAKEKESMEASKEEFEKVNDLMDKLDDKQTQAQAKKMYDMMMKRYKAYDTLYTSYNHSLELEKQLYEMLPDEDIEQEKLTEHISKLNDSYQDVLEANKAFNTDTTEYNELKKEFYQAADLDVEYQSDEKQANKKNDKKS
ncbi:YkyA family protein [Lentibacillus sp. N15]|uniref:YkyA family protein n=1 Tax=Lentibacillus songyuanensis TaxID=3136161 RepID=UPI0031BAC708